MYVAVRDKDTTYIGVTTRDNYTAGALVRVDPGDRLHPDNLPIWKVPDHPGVMMASGGVGIVKDVLRYKPILFGDKVSAQAVIREVVPTIRKCSADFGQITSGNRYRGAYVIASPNKLVTIGSNLLVSEPEYATSAYFDLVKGSMEATKGLPGVERILEAFRIAADYTNNLIFPVAIYDVKTGKRKVYERIGNEIFVQSKTK